MVRRLLPSSGSSPTALAARFEHLVLLAGLALPTDELRSLQRDEILRFTASVLDLALDRRVLAAPDEVRQLLETPPVDWEAREIRLARFLAAGSWSQRELSAEDADIETLLFELALFLGILDRDEVLFLQRDGDRLEIKSHSRRLSASIPRQVPTYLGDSSRAAARPLSVLPGDRLELVRHREELLAMIKQNAADVPDLAAKASRQSWTETIGAHELTARAGARYPGFPLLDFEVISRGVSGRVGKLRLLGAGGREIVVEGLAIRWTLGLNDTLFYVERSSSASGERSWHFRGRGWGHGVGMCQVGAYGMATRGSSYRDILDHYYSGIVLGRIRSTLPRPRDENRQRD